MTDSAPAAPTREVVGLFTDRADFDSATHELLTTGFDRTDLSVLSSHDSLDSADAPASPWKEAVLALAGEYKIIGPLVASGGIFLAGGPMAATVAAVVGAAVGSIAVKEVIDEVTSAHNADFQRALEAGGLILWVRVANEGSESHARRILETHRARNIHLHEGGHPEPA